MSRRLALLGTAIGALALGLATAPAARATLTLTVLDNGVPVSGTTTITPGGLDFIGSAPGFASISAIGSGVPALPAPDLCFVTLDAKSLGTSTRTLSLELIQSGLPSAPALTSQTTVRTLACKASRSG